MSMGLRKQEKVEKEKHLYVTTWNSRKRWSQLLNDREMATEVQLQQNKW